MDDQILDINTRMELPSGFNQPFQPEPKWKRVLKNKAVIFSSISAVILIALIGWYFLAGKKVVAPTSTNVLLMIKGPDQLVSSNEAEYRIIYRNGENADLINLSMEVFYPSGFQFKSSTPVATNSNGTKFNLPMVKEGQDGEVIIRGKLSGSTGESKQIKANLHYRLSNFNSDFMVNQSLNTSILPPNLTMDINGPVDVINGQDTTYTITFTNVTSQDFDNLALTLAHPEGFSFSSSNIPPSRDNNYWRLAKLAAGSSASLEITGSFAGNTNDIKLVKADLGQIINNVFAPQLMSTATFKIIPSSLAITLNSDVEGDVVNLGTNINYTLNYANQGRIGLNNLIIVVNLEGPALDIARLSAQNAIVSGRTITWKAATMPGLNVLSPNERGEIRFNIPIVQNINTNLKNQVIKATASVTADEAPKATRAPDLNLKLASQLDLIVQGEYVSGAAPMEVGKPTLFSMTFLLSNLSNDLSNTKVVASLPLPSSSWKNVIIPEAERNRLSYDSNSGKITWNIGDLAAFTGRYIPVSRVSFQLEVMPSEVDRNRDVNLLSDIQATGTDTFTGKTLETTNITDVTTSTIDDDVMNLRGATVK